MELLRRGRKSMEAYKTAITSTRRGYLERGARHPRYAPTVEAFRAVVEAHADAKCAAQAESFLGADLYTQAYYHRHYGRRKWSKSNCLFGVPEVDEAFRAIELLPENYLQLKLTTEENDEVKASGQVALKRKSRVSTVVMHAGELLDMCRSIAKDAEKQTQSRLIIALLCLSGRRMTELLSPASHFEAAATSEYACRFTGQLKKAPGASKPYCIPLLVQFGVFARAVKALRAKQGPNVGTKTNAQLGKNSGNLKLCIKRHFAKYLPGATPHTLRSAYARMVEEAFDVGSSALSYVVMEALGHEQLQESLHYTPTQLRDFDSHRNTLGPLPQPSCD